MGLDPVWCKVRFGEKTKTKENQEIWNIIQRVTVNGSWTIFTNYFIQIYDSLLSKFEDHANSLDQFGL